MFGTIWDFVTSADSLVLFWNSLESSALSGDPQKAQSYRVRFKGYGLGIPRNAGPSGDP